MKFINHSFNFRLELQQLWSYYIKLKVERGSKMTKLEKMEGQERIRFYLRAYKRGLKTAKVGGLRFRNCFSKLSWKQKKHLINCL